MLKKYGVLNLVGLYELDGDSTSTEIAKVIGPATKEHYTNLRNYFNTDGIAITFYSDTYYPCNVYFDDSIDNGQINIDWLVDNAAELNKHTAIIVLNTNGWTIKFTNTTILDRDYDKYKSALGTSVQMPNAVGGIAVGTTVATLNGKKQNEIIDMLLFPEQQPQVVAPSATILLSSGFVNNEIMEVGMTAPVAGTNIKTLLVLQLLLLTLNQEVKLLLMLVQ